MLSSLTNGSDDDGWYGSIARDETEPAEDVGVEKRGSLFGGMQSPDLSQRCSAQGVELCSAARLEPKLGHGEGDEETRRTEEEEEDGPVRGGTLYTI